jgi:hypothetical protein
MNFFKIFYRENAVEHLFLYNKIIKPGIVGSDNVFYHDGLYNEMGPFKNERSIVEEYGAEFILTRRVRVTFCNPASVENSDAFRLYSCAELDDFFVKTLDLFFIKFLLVTLFGFLFVFVFIFITLFKYNYLSSRVASILKKIGRTYIKYCNWLIDFYTVARIGYVPNKIDGFAPDHKDATMKKIREAEHLHNIRIVVRESELDTLILDKEKLIRVFDPKRALEVEIKSYHDLIKPQNATDLSIPNPVLAKRELLKILNEGYHIIAPVGGNEPVNDFVADGALSSSLYSALVPENGTHIAPRNILLYNTLLPERYSYDYERHKEGISVKQERRARGLIHDDRVYIFVVPAFTITLAFCIFYFCMIFSKSILFTIFIMFSILYFVQYELVRFDDTFMEEERLREKARRQKKKEFLESRKKRNKAREVK